MKYVVIFLEGNREWIRYHDSQRYPRHIMRSFPLKTKTYRYMANIAMGVFLGQFKLK